MSGIPGQSHSGSGPQITRVYGSLLFLPHATLSKLREFRCLVVLPLQLLEERLPRVAVEVLVRAEVLREPVPTPGTHFHATAGRTRCSLEGYQLK